MRGAFASYKRSTLSDPPRCGPTPVHPLRGRGLRASIPGLQPDNEMTMDGFGVNCFRGEEIVPFHLWEDEQMSWIGDCLKRQIESPGRRERVAKVSRVTQETWELIAEAIQSDVLEYSDSDHGRCLFSWNSSFLITVVPLNPSHRSAVIQVDGQGVIYLSCPPFSPGEGRHGSFNIDDGLIVSTGDFVGLPKPGNKPMTPRGFSAFVLKPLLFPDL